jgi:hypothetical protein
MASSRRRRAIWAGRVAAALIVAGLVVYLLSVGLDAADKIGSAVSVVVAVVAFLAPYLMAAPGPSEPDANPARGVTLIADSVIGLQIVQRGRAKQINKFGNEA